MRGIEVIGNAAAAVIPVEEAWVLLTRGAGTGTVKYEPHYTIFYKSYHLISAKLVFCFQFF